MKRNTKKIMDGLLNKEMNVVRVTKTEFELNNGDIFQHTFELDEEITIDEFQKLLDDSKNIMINHLW